jgi:hypothetical protein
MDKDIVDQCLKTISEEELIKILSIRINSNLFVPCAECCNENDEFPYFGLELNFKMVCDLPLCKKHRKQYNCQNNH